MLDPEEAAREGHRARGGGARLPHTPAAGADGGARFVTGIVLTARRGKSCDARTLRALSYLS